MMSSDYLYRFYRYEEVEEKWLSPYCTSSTVKPGTLCWVLRGRRSKSKKKKQNHSQEQQQQQQQEQQQQQQQQEQRKILFQRAIIVETKTKTCDDNSCDDGGDDDDRILVRYPMGSTYRVKYVNLWPILRETGVVICLAETLLYRKWALACTQAKDAFVEIGCDVGILVHRVHALSECPEKVWGLDACRASIVQAQKRFPECHFRQWRVPLLLEEGQQQQVGTNDQGENTNTNIRKDKMANDQEDDDNQQLLYSKRPTRRPLPEDLFPNTNGDDNYLQGNNNLVVAVDINGNRELSVVQQCIQIVIQEWKPRLIIVKSETLYEHLDRTRKE
jgi:hypothetical protein